MYNHYMIKIEVTKGEEVIEKIARILKKNKIKQGSISLIGAVDACSIGNMPKDDATKEIFTEYYEPLEVSGTGEIIDGKPHIHVTLGRSDNSALFGHLQWGKVETWFVNVYITEL